MPELRGAKKRKSKLYRSKSPSMKERNKLKKREEKVKTKEEKQKLNNYFRSRHSTFLRTLKASLKDKEDKENEKKFR